MADDGEEKKHRGLGRLLNKAGLRSKSDTRDEPEPPPSPQPALTDDVVDFLRPSTSRAKSNPPRAPKIDIAAAKRYADQAADHRINDGLITPSSLRTRKQPRRPGLKVGFVATPPEIMGCGGEEEETPPAEIGHMRRARQGDTAGVQRHLGGHPTLPQVPLSGNMQLDGSPNGGHRERPFEFVDGGGPHLHGRSFGGMENRYPQTPGHGGFQTADPHSSYQQQPTQPQPVDDFRPKAMRRTQTGRTNSIPDPEHEDVFTMPKIRRVSTGFSKSSAHQDDAARSSNDNSPDSASNVRRQSYHLPELNSVLDDSPIETSRRSSHLPASPQDPGSFSAQLMQRMKSDEGRALHQAARSPRPSDDDEQSGIPETIPPRAPVHRPAVPSAPYQNASYASDRLAPQQQSGLPIRGPPSPQSQFPPQMRPSPTYNSQQTPPVQSHDLRPAPRPMPSSRTNSFQPPPPPPHKPSPSPKAPSVPSPRQQLPYQPERRPSEAPDLTPLVIPEARQSAQRTASTASSRTLSTANSAQPNMSLRSAPSAGGSALANQGALDDFAERCSHMNGIFRLQAEFDRPIHERSPNEWLRATAWWFIRARGGLEAMIRSRPRNQDGIPVAQQAENKLQQPHVDLAKCHWIVSEVLTKHRDLPPSSDATFAHQAEAAKQAGDLHLTQLFEGVELILAHLRGLCGSMSRNNVMPPHNALIQGQDQSIWITSPDIPHPAQPILSNITQADPLSVMALAETRDDFVYNRVFTDITLGNKGSKALSNFPCLISLMRSRNDWQPRLCVCTQKSAMTVVVRGSRSQGPSWSDVQWSEKDQLIRINLPQDWWMDLRLEAQDFRQIYAMYNHSYEVQHTLLPAQGEQLVFDDQLREFQFIDTRRVLIFPPERIKRCRVKVFAKSEPRMRGDDRSVMLHIGFRLVVVTNSQSKMLGVVSHEIGTDYPIFVALSDEQGPGESLPVLNVQVIEEDRKCQFFMGFGSEQARSAFYNVVANTTTGQDEINQGKLRLKAYTIDRCDGDPIGPISTCQWQSVSVIEAAPRPQTSNGSSQPPATTNPQKRRIVSSAMDATISDYLTRTFDPLLIRLPVNGQETLLLLRPPQEDLDLTLQTNLSRITPDSATEILELIRKTSTIRAYTFFSAINLHAFQKAVTGQTVLYDGIVSTFSISRKRGDSSAGRSKFSLGRKTLEAGISRIQTTLSADQRSILLLAFFEDFPAADSLLIPLSPTDAMEPIDLKGEKSGRGRYGVKLVDCRFNLPSVGLSTKQELRALMKRVKDAQTGVDHAYDDEDKEETAAVAVANRKFVRLDDEGRGLDECEDLVIGFDSENVPLYSTIRNGTAERRKILSFVSSMNKIQVFDDFRFQYLRV